MRLCTTCGSEAVVSGNTATCTSPECGVVRILPAMPERLPWETEGRPWETSVDPEGQ